MWLRGGGDEVSSLAGGTESQASVVITMARSFYSHIKEAWRSPGDGKLAELQWQRKQEWRRQGAIVRVDRPTRLDKARELGYKAKQGVVVARVSVRKGTARKQRHKAGRRSKRQGVKRISRRKSIQRIGEERVSRKYPNLRVLNSYWVGEDGSQKWFEVILVDPEHPAIENDDDLNWICSDKHKGRAFRGLTNAGTDNRGLNNRGKGSEHVRPSVSSGQGRGK
jgi:large subunit ribosomal protein L15e